MCFLFVQGQRAFHINQPDFNSSLTGKEVKLAHLIDQKEKSDHTKFLSSNNYMGYDLFYPNLKKGWKNTDPWLAMNVQASYVRMGIGFGRATKVINDDTVSRIGNMKFIGVFYNHPIRILKNQLTIEPEIGLDFISAQFRDNRESNPNSLGFGVTPGLGIKAGPLKVVAKYHASFAYTIGDNSNAWSGGMTYPVFSAFFETGWGLMSPKRIKSKGILTTSETSRYYLGTYPNLATVDQTDYVAVYREVTTFYDHEIKSSIHDVRPFFFIMPVAKTSMIVSSHNLSSRLIGVESGFRSGVFAVEGFFQQGNLGFESPISTDDLKSHYGFLPDLSGQIASQSYGGRVGFEFTSLLTKIFVHSHQNAKIYKATRFTRLIVSYGMGATSFIGNPVYHLPDGEARLNNILADKPEFKPKEENMPGKTPSDVFNTWSFKMEMGIVTLGYERYNYQKAKFADQNMITLGFMIPPGRIVSKLKALAVSKKIAKAKKAEKKN